MVVEDWSVSGSRVQSLGFGQFETLEPSAQNSSSPSYASEDSLLFCMVASAQRRRGYIAGGHWREMDRDLGEPFM